jgi:hypothetical protein
VISKVAIRSSHIAFRFSLFAFRQKRKPTVKWNNAIGRFVALSEATVIRGQGRHFPASAGFALFEMRARTGLRTM